MKEKDVKIQEVYQTKINGQWCSVRITASRRVPNYYLPGAAKTLFDWVRLYPPPNAKTLRGADPASRLRPVIRAHPLGDVEPTDLSGDPAHDTAAGGEPAPECDPEDE